LFYLSILQVPDFTISPIFDLFTNTFLKNQLAAYTILTAQINADARFYKNGETCRNIELWSKTVYRNIYMVTPTLAAAVLIFGFLAFLISGSMGRGSF